MRPALSYLLHDYIVASADKQGQLSAVVEGFPSQFDLHLGLLSFGGCCTWHAQLLGTESQSSNTWLWAWANTAGDIPALLLTASLALKAYGEQHGIPELTTPQLPLDQI